MCEANAYIIKNGEEEIYLESVDIIRPEGEEIYLRNIFGEQKVFKGKIKEMSLLNHKIILQEDK
ncbi:MAG TPA: CooT family nickel-binding protein [Thermodesulfovibrio thiophilus]|mgnify:CR=1 FL=1|uniref:CooT family nickel-binding protein n=1 Tax=Thermodesulfovibrio thiophilus TaxID=340095 RepID=UPI00041F0C1A|nr:CooT family nickel-binding protein [Thermodesulfovibrio thiophilus]HHW21108.1 CooT family nickel-binding protein [Thermodesulfovibrio thiophilus]HOA83242.1 CooT family nickel-binding protein [Thermodesulfovibrio thiophilus]HQA03930.1 CooT family nickel-binding protein [Thermodesulfovibrio thiophilus]HQD36556.1 CooT family nickel-binding protein [Thermodesulfovibrio thiophilus]